MSKGYDCLAAAPSGLATAGRVSAWYEAHGIDYDKTVARIPIVRAAIVFDLREAGAARPDRDAGWTACGGHDRRRFPMGATSALGLPPPFGPAVRAAV